MRLLRLTILVFIMFFMAACDTEDASDTDDEQPGDIDDDTDTVSDDENDTDVDTDDDTITLEFVDVDGNVIDAIEINEESDFIMPDAPDKEGHYFVHWDIPELTYTEDKIIEPVYEINVYEITIEGPEGVIETKDIEHGETLSLDEPQAMEGYVFIEYEENDFTVYEDMVIEAIFNPIAEVTIYFYEWDETLIESISGYLDEDFEIPKPESFADYTFIGWSDEIEGEVIDIYTLDEGEHHLYPIYEGKEVVVSFDLNDGSEVIEKTFNMGDIVTEDDFPEIPSRDDYEFLHWYDAYWDVIVVELYVYEGATIEAKWQGVTDEWLFETKDGEAILTEYLGDDKDLVIPDEIGGKPVTIISEAMFEYSIDEGYELDTLVIGQNVHTIKGRAFENQNELESVVFKNPDAMRHIHNHAFSNVVAEDLIVPKYLKTIGPYAFSRTEITEISLKGDIEVIGEWAFGYASLSGEVVFPDTLVAIEASAFAFSEVSAIDLNDGLKTIGNGAFNGLEEIESVFIPASVEYIGRSAFRRMSALEVVTFEAGSQLSEINDNTFSDADSLETIHLPDNLEIIGHHAFSNNQAMSHINIPNSVTTIKPWAFSSMSELYEITIPQGIEVLAERIFYDTDSLKHVHLPDSLEIIESNAFYQATAIEEIELPDGLKVIEGDAFRQATSLHTINLPQSLETLKHGVFRETDSLNEITIPSNITIIPYWLFLNSGVNHVELHDDIKIIENRAFQNTENLQNIILPENLERIEHNAFNNSNLHWIYIYEGLEHMSNYVFDGASDVIIYHEGPYTPSHWLDFNPQNRPIEHETDLNDIME